MKRRLFKLVVFLLLGAVVNVAVAWGCAAWADPYLGEHYQSTDEGPGYWAVERGGGAGLTLVVSWWGGDWAREHGTPRRSMERYLPSWVPSTPPVVTSEQSADVLQTACAAGWPYRALSGRAVLSYTNNRSQYVVVAVSGIQLTPVGTGTHARILPLRSLWPGFWLNTVFYTLILWVLWLSPFAARRIVRLRRGRCIKCGYDLRGAEHEVCPECGVEV